LWPAFKAGLGAAVGELQPTFDQLKTIGVDAWGGIVASIKKNDFKTAGEIAVKSLQLAWHMGLDGMSDAWDSFLNEFIKKAIAAFKDVAKAYLDNNPITKLMPEKGKMVLIDLIGAEQLEKIKQFEKDRADARRVDEERAKRGIFDNPEVARLKRELDALQEKARQPIGQGNFAGLAGNLANNPLAAAASAANMDQIPNGAGIWKRINEVASLAAQLPTFTRTAAGTFSGRDAGRSLGPSGVFNKIEENGADAVRALIKLIGVVEENGAEFT